MRSKGFSLPEAMLVTGLTSCMMMLVHKLVVVAYPVQAKKRAEISTVREATVFLDRLVQQCQTGRKIFRGDNGQVVLHTVHLQAVPLVVGWNLEGSLVHDRYTLQGEVVRHERFDETYRWNQPATWLPLDGFEAPGKAALGGVQALDVQRTIDRGVELLEFRLQLAAHKQAVCARVALP
jgi:hypothetical protein